MRIRITRRGGLAGIPLSAEFETDAMREETAGRLQELVQLQAGRAPDEARPPHPDAFVYEITVLDGGPSVSVAESEVPVELRPLMRELSAKGRIGPPPSTD